MQSIEGKHDNLGGSGRVANEVEVENQSSISWKEFW